MVARGTQSEMDREGAEGGRENGPVRVREKAREGVRSANGGECKLETLGQKAGGRGPG